MVKLIFICHPEPVEGLIFAFRQAQRDSLYLHK